SIRPGTSLWTEDAEQDMDLPVPGAGPRFGAPVAVDGKERVGARPTRGHGGGFAAECAFLGRSPGVDRTGPGAGRAAHRVYDPRHHRRGLRAAALGVAARPLSAHLCADVPGAAADWAPGAPVVAPHRGRRGPARAVANQTRKLVCD